MTNAYFPIGSEHQYTADGIYINADGVHSTKYKILDENHLEMTTLEGNIATVIYDYELNGDELVQYGNYSGDYAKYGHSNAVYLKRK